MCVCVCLCPAVFRVEVQLDRQKQKGAVRRALFVDSQQPSLIRSLTVPNGARHCHETKIYLRVSSTPPSLFLSAHISVAHHLF